MWQTRAACRGLDTDRFYPGVGERDPSRGVREEHAKLVCNGTPTAPPCPVRMECLTWALTSGDGWAVLGGTTPDERARLAGRRRRCVTPRVDPAQVADVARMTADGHSARDIAGRLGMDRRGVTRYRARARDAS